MRAGDLLHIPSDVLLVETESGEEPLRYIDKYMFTAKPELAIYLNKCKQLEGYSRIVCGGQVWLVLSKSIHLFERSTKGDQHASRIS